MTQANEVRKLARRPVEEIIDLRQIFESRLLIERISAQQQAEHGHAGHQTNHDVEKDVPDHGHRPTAISLRKAGT